MSTTIFSVPEGHIVLTEQPQAVLDPIPVGVHTLPVYLWLLDPFEGRVARSVLVFDELVLAVGDKVLSLPVPG